MEVARMLSLVRPAMRCTVRPRRLLGNCHFSLPRGFATVDNWGEMNDSIDARVVHIVEDGGNLRADVPIHQAIQDAQSQGLDLVQVSPKGKLPTVCKLFDARKRLYELKKASKNGTNHHKAKIDKEVVIGAKIAPNDLNMKVDQVKRFLTKGHNVKVTINLIDAEMGVRNGEPKDQHGGVYVYYAPIKHKLSCNTCSEIR